MSATRRVNVPEKWVFQPLIPAHGGSTLNVDGGQRRREISPPTRKQRSDDTPTMLGQGEALEEVKSLGLRTDSLDVLDVQGAAVIAAGYASVVFNSSTLVCQASSSGATPEGRFR